MSLKQATKQSVNQVLDAHFVDHIVSAGFKYLEKQSKFKLEEGEFKCEVVLKPELDILHLKERDEVRFSLSISANYFSSKFRSWFKKNLVGLPHRVNFFRQHQKFLIYEQSFDANNHNAEELQKIKTYITLELKSILSTLNNWEKIISNYDKVKQNIDLEDIYLFLKDNTKAAAIIKQKKESYLSRPEFIKKHYYLVNNLDYKLINVLGEKPEIPQIKYSLEKSSDSYQVGQDLQLNRQFIISELPKTLRTKTSRSGKYFISVHLSAEAVLWGPDGELVYHKRLINKKTESLSFDGIKPGFLEEKNLWFLDQHFYSLEDGSLQFSLELYDEKKKRTKLRFQQLFYLASEGKVVANFEKSNIGVFDLSGVLLSRFTIDGSLVNVRQKSGELITYGNKKYSFVNLNNQETRSFKGILHNSIHKLSKDESLFFTAGYNTKQYLYNLDSGKVKTIWAHPTHKSDYKALFAKVCHNFGCSQMAFSDDGKMLALSADHGRNSIFRLPSLDRTEIKSREKFNYEWHKVGFSFGLKCIAFYDSEKVFTAINDKLVVWDQSGDELFELNDVWKFELSPNKDFILCIGKESGLSKLEIQPAITRAPS
ncbi:MAG: hypothetical protein AAFO03_16430 [Bacteroidota bacterium]